jgi:hypothetical protein
VPRLLQGGDDLVPRRAVEPEASNQDDVHGPTLRHAAGLGPAACHESAGVVGWRPGGQPLCWP